MRVGLAVFIACGLFALTAARAPAAGPVVATIDDYANSTFSVTDNYEIILLRGDDGTFGYCYARPKGDSDRQLHFWEGPGSRTLTFQVPEWQLTMGASYQASVRVDGNPPVSVSALVQDKNAVAVDLDDALIGQLRAGNQVVLAAAQAPYAFSLQGAGQAWDEVHRCTVAYQPPKAPAQQEAKPSNPFETAQAPQANPVVRGGAGLASKETMNDFIVTIDNAWAQLRPGWPVGTDGYYFRYRQEQNDPLFEYSIELQEGPVSGIWSLQSDSDDGDALHNEAVRYIERICPEGTHASLADRYSEFATAYGVDVVILTTRLGCESGGEKIVLFISTLAGRGRSTNFLTRWDGDPADAGIVDYSRFLALAYAKSILEGGRPQ